MYYVIDYNRQKQCVIFDARTNRLGSMACSNLLDAARSFKQDSWVVTKSDKLHIADNVFTVQRKQYPIIATVKSIKERYLKTNHPELLI